MKVKIRSKENENERGEGGRAIGVGGLMGEREGGGCWLESGERENGDGWGGKKKNWV